MQGQRRGRERRKRADARRPARAAGDRWRRGGGRTGQSQWLSGPAPPRLKSSLSPSSLPSQNNAPWSRVGLALTITARAELGDFCCAAGASTQDQDPRPNDREPPGLLPTSIWSRCAPCHGQAGAAGRAGDNAEAWRLADCFASAALPVEARLPRAGAPPLPFLGVQWGSHGAAGDAPSDMLGAASRLAARASQQP